jgi:hypothetical protein
MTELWTARNGGVIHRAKKDVERYAGAAAFVDRGSMLVQSSYRGRVQQLGARVLVTHVGSLGRGTEPRQTDLPSRGSLAEGWYLALVSSSGSRNRGVGYREETAGQPPA